jgi:hypothetical protein
MVTWAVTLDAFDYLMTQTRNEGYMSQFTPALSCARSASQPGTRLRQV